MLCWCSVKQRWVIDRRANTDVAIFLLAFPVQSVVVRFVLSVDEIVVLQQHSTAPSSYNFSSQLCHVAYSCKMWKVCCRKCHEGRFYGELGWKGFLVSSRMGPLSIHHQQEERTIKVFYSTGCYYQRCCGRCDVTSTIPLLSRLLFC